MSASSPSGARSAAALVAFALAVPAAHAGASAYVTAAFTPNPAPLSVPVHFDWQAVGPVGACTLSGVPGHEGPVPASGSIDVMASRGIAAVVLCSAATPGDPPVSTQVVLATVDANVKPEVYASFSPDAIGLGQSSTFRWGSRYATNCWSDSQLVQVHGAQGSWGVRPDGNESVTVTCSGPGGMNSATAYLWVRERAPVVHLRLTRDASYPAGYVDIWWDGEYASTCNGGPPQGRMLYHALASEWHPITCSGPGGKSTGYVWIDLATLGRGRGAPLPDLSSVGLDARKASLRIARGDVDLDGRDDVLAVDAATRTAYALRGAKDGGFSVAAVLQGVDDVADIASVDVAVDGRWSLRRVP